MRYFGIVALLALLPVVQSRALEPATPLSRLARQSWSVENGLPQNTVPVLLQSRSGYLWVGTELGLARFDGTGFRNFDHATSPLFPDAEVRCLLDATTLPGKPGDLWVGTGGGLLRWSSGGLPGDNLANAHPTLLTTRDGLPGDSIQKLVQAGDGTVWAWTDAGLARWTGARFESVPLGDGQQAGEITSVAAGTGGDLWVGTTNGAAVFHRGAWHRHWFRESGSDPGSDSGPGSGLASGRPVRNSGVFPGFTTLVASAGDGSDVLIAASAGVFLDHTGTVSPVAGPDALPGDGVSFLVRLADGTIAIAGKSSVALVRNASIHAPVSARFAVERQLPGSRIESLLADREGSLWIGTNRGLARVAPGPAAAHVELLPANDPLASDAVVAFLEDAEGDLWVGTETAGLHLLRDARFRTIGTGDGLASDATTAIVEDAHGTVWIGTRDAGLNRVADSQVTIPATRQTARPAAPLTTASGLLSNVILALAAAPNGDLWVGTPDGLNRIGTHGVASYTSADGLPDDFIRSVLAAPDGSIWVGTRHGLTHLDHGRFQNFSQADGLGSDLVGALAGTPDGDLWIATLNGLTRLHQGRLRNYTTADGLSSNVITALEVTPDGTLWIGTQNDGLNVWNGQLWNGQRFKPIGQRSGPLPRAIHGILHDDREHLWLASATGLTRANTQSLLDCASHSSCAITATHFTTADGLRSRETSSNSHPTACRRANGELWFTTPRGVIVVDPNHFASAPAAPPVVIERFAVNDNDADKDAGGDVSSSAGASIPAGALRFQFDYAGLSFAAPQKLRYQYMLEGFDHSWTDAGIRRTAYYTNIPPGKYRFRVRAAFADSTAAAANPQSSEASLSFELLPHFYSTLWFRALVVLFIAALVLWFFRRRVMRVEREFRAVMGERNRIAREIHDTLAQGYVGISLQLEILGQLLRHKRTDAAAEHLALTQQLVREGLDDARQSIWALRSQDAGEQTLPIRLRRLVEQAQSADLAAGLAAEFAIHGAYRALDPEVEKEVLRIAQEAIQNVRLHAHASRLNVRLDYDERVVVVAVTDDGRGFLTSGQAPHGHFGLTGMRERASLIHAELEVVSQPGAGTTVRLTVAAPELSHRNRPIVAEELELTGQTGLAGKIKE